MKKALLISIASYLIFFFPVLNKNLTIYSGKDSTNYFYPSRFYLSEKLQEGEFPFYTERVFSGFPIFADPERAYLHPVNLVSTYLLGPIDSYKLIHFASYLAGSIGLYLLLKNKGVNVLGFSVANLAYFFSHYILFHQQHFGITLEVYTIPLLVYLTDVFVRKKNLIHLALSGLVILNSFYFGNIQLTTVLFGIQFLYLLINKVNVKYHLLNILLLVLVSLPLAIPASELFLNSARNTSGVEFTQGALYPTEAANFFTPEIYGDYFGTQIEKDHYKHEVYIYMGAAAFILGIVGLWKMERNKFRDFLTALLFVSFGLVFIKYIPLLNFIPIPGVSFFRFWGRGAILAIFALSVGAGFAVGKGKLEGKNWFLTAFPIATGILTILNFKETMHFLRVLKHNYVFDPKIIVWILVILTTFAALRLKSELLLVVVVIFDIIFFGHSIISFTNVSNLPTKLNVEAESSRVLILDNSIEQNKGLYTPHWGVFGYTPLVDSRYMEYMINLGFRNTKGPELIDTLNPNFWKLNSMILTDVPYETTVLEEGRLAFTFVSDTKQEIYTSIRNYRGWKLFVNGTVSEFSSEPDDLFVSFELEEGVHEVNMIYLPYNL